MKINWSEVDWEVWLGIAIIIILLIIAALVGFSLARTAPVA